MSVITQKIRKPAQAWVRDIVRTHPVPPQAVPSNNPIEQVPSKGLLPLDEVDIASLGTHEADPCKPQAPEDTIGALLILVEFWHHGTRQPIRACWIQP